MCLVGAFDIHSCVDNPAFPAANRTIRVDSMGDDKTENLPLRILITGFGPFGNVIHNPSARIVRWFKRAAIPGTEIVTLEFRVSYNEVDRRLPRVLENSEFDVV